MLSKIFQLGLVYKDGKVINHRSLIKILLNPILRTLFEKAIGSIVEDNKFIKYRIINQTEPKGFSFRYNGDYDYIK